MKMAKQEQLASSAWEGFRSRRLAAGAQHGIPPGAAGRNVGSVHTLRLRHTD